MTVVIGIKTPDGAVLAADCLGTRNEETFVRRKIADCLYTSETGVQTGIVYGTAGYYLYTDCGLMKYDASPTLCDLLVDADVLGSPISDVRKKVYALEEEGWDYTRIEEQRRNRNLWDAKLRMSAFIENTRVAPAFQVSRLALRITEDASDLLLIQDGAVSSVMRYGAMGSGKDRALPVLSRSPLDTVDDAVHAAAAALNTVLEDGKAFGGYQLVILRREHGRNNISAFIDYYATSIDLSNLHADRSFG
jgi:hypothetical protein